MNFTIMFDGLQLLELVICIVIVVVLAIVIARDEMRKGRK